MSEKRGAAPSKRSKGYAGETLLQCCFCDARFENPAELSIHLDRYDVNWKLYWQLFYSRQCGQACVLCNVLHADRKSLECHFKMVHCIGEHQAALEPSQPMFGVEQGNNRSPKAAGTAAEENDEPTPFGTMNIDEVDLTVKESLVDTQSVSPSSRATPESLNLALASTPSGTDRTSTSEDEVHILECPETHEEEITLIQGTEDRTARNECLIIAEGTHDLTQLVSKPTVFSVLTPNDEVEEIDVNDLSVLPEEIDVDDLSVLPQSGSELAATTDSALCSKVDHHSVQFAEKSTPDCMDEEIEMLHQSQSVTFTSGVGHDRPTAVVNPFGSHDGEYPSRTSKSDADLSVGQHVLDISEPVQTPSINNMRFLPVNPEKVIPSTSFAGSQNMVAVYNAAFTVSKEGPNTTESTEQQMLLSSTPPNFSANDKKPSAYKLAKKARSTLSRDISDLSHLTPSKIAVLMNRDIFPQTLQSDLEYHLDHKQVADHPWNDSHEVDVKPMLDPLSNENPAFDCDDKLEAGSRNVLRDGDAAWVFREDAENCLTKDEPGPSSTNPLVDEDDPWLEGLSLSSSDDAARDEDAVPSGLNIVSVETVMSKTLDNDEPELESSRLAMTDEASEASDLQNSGLSRSRKLRRKASSKLSPKGGLERPKRTRGTPKRSVHRKSSLQEKAEKPDSRSAAADSEQGGTETAVPLSEVFKQPIWECVGVIHAGSLVEVSIGDLGPSTPRKSLDGMVMKVAEAESPVRYFIHFPNMDVRHDRWVTKADIIKVYRTGGSPATDLAGSQIQASPVGQVKRRLSFEPARTTAAAKQAKSLESHREARPQLVDVRRRRGRPRKIVRIGVTARGHSQSAESRRETRAEVAEEPVPSRPGKSPKSPTVAVPRRAFQVSQSKQSHRVGLDSSANEQTMRNVEEIPGSPMRRSHKRKTGQAISSRIASELQPFVGQGETDDNASGDTMPSVETPVHSLPNDAESDDHRRPQSSPEGFIAGPGDSLPAASKSRLRRQGRRQASRKVFKKQNQRERKYKLDKHPPAGLSIKRAVGPVLNNLSTGSLVYVEGVKFRDGWRRLYPGRIESVLRDSEPVRYRVHYTGWPIGWDEWLTADVIHSEIIIEDASINPNSNSLRKTWIVPPVTAESGGSEHTTPKIAKPAGSTSSPASQRRLSAHLAAGAPGTSGAAPKRRGRPPKSARIAASGETPRVHRRDGDPVDKHAVVEVEQLPVSALVGVAVPPDASEEPVPSSAGPTSQARSAGPKAADRRARDLLRSKAGRNRLRRLKALLALRASRAAAAPSVSGPAKCAAPSTQTQASEPSPGEVESAEPPAKRRPGRPPKVPRAPVGTPAASPASAPAAHQPGAAPTASQLTSSSSTRKRRAPRPDWEFSADRAAAPDTPQLSGPFRAPDCAAGDSAAPSGLGARKGKQEHSGGHPSSPAATGPPRLTRSDVSWSGSGEDAPGSGEAPSLSAAVAPPPAKRRGRPPSYSASAAGEASTPPPPPKVSPGDQRQAISGAAGPTTGEADDTRPRIRPSRHERAEAAPLQPPGDAATPTASNRKSGSAVAGTVVPKLPSKAPTATSDADTGSTPPSLCDSASDTSAGPSSSVTTVPYTDSAAKRLKVDDVVYVVYEIKSDGTKFIYPAKLLKINKDLHYTRFFIHYLGWGQRYDEWVAKEVIHSIVTSRLKSVKCLKRQVVPPAGRKTLSAAYHRLRPCSVDLSRSNICFFSALRKASFHVDDSRIMAIRAAREAARGNK